MFWVLLQRFWSGWQKPLMLVTPRTVVEWHRAGFRLYWKWLSKAQQVGGRKPVASQMRDLIFRMAAENPTWGAPRIHGELMKLGFKVSEPTVSRWLRRVPRPPNPTQRWLTFLRNHLCSAESRCDLTQQFLRANIHGAARREHLALLSGNRLATHADGFSRGRGLLPESGSRGPKLA